MALADDLKALADNSRARLDAGHDYYTHTKAVWRLLHEYVKAGVRFTVSNKVTGTAFDQQGLLRQAQHYVTDYLDAATFQHFVTLFEDFLFDFLRLWLAAYPGSLSAKMVDFGTVLAAPDLAALKLAVIDKELNELKYKRVGEWFAYLEKLARLGTPAPDEIEKVAEIKASRDVLVHNKGIANALYLARAAGRARCHVGDRLELPEPYHRDSWQTLKKVIADLEAAAIRKLSTP